MSASKPDYTVAIAYREMQIEKLQTNPPAEWTQDYTDECIQTIRDQIASFKGEQDVQV